MDDIPTGPRKNNLGNKKIALRVITHRATTKIHDNITIQRKN